MSATGSVPLRGVRHTAPAYTLALRMADAGWNDAAIHRALHRQGHLVTSKTVARWVRPAAAAAARERSRRHAARRAAQRGAAGGLIPRNARPEFCVARIEALRDLGLDLEHIAAVMTFDAPHQPVTARDVYRALAGVVTAQGKPTGRKCPDCDHDVLYRGKGRPPTYCDPCGFERRKKHRPVRGGADGR